MQSPAKRYGGMGAFLLLTLMFSPAVAADRVQYHLYLGNDDASEVVRKAWTVSMCDHPGTMDPEAFRASVSRHERLRLDILQVADVVLHNEDIHRVCDTPAYSFSEYEDPRPFGWVESQRETGLMIRAYRDTLGCLKHQRYICRIAREHLKENPAKPFGRFGAYAGNSQWGVSYFSFCPNPEFMVYPEYRQKRNFEMSFTTPILSVQLHTPPCMEPTSDEAKAAVKWMDMGTGILVDEKP